MIKIGGKPFYSEEEVADIFAQLEKVKTCCFNNHLCNEEQIGCWLCVSEGELESIKKSILGRE